MLTNSPPVAGALAAHPRAEVVLIGGRLLKDSLVTVGSATVDALRQVRADACVLGICSLHPELGVTVTDHDEAHVKRAMVEASAEVIALATADKLRTAGPWVVAPLADLTYLVTDARRRPDRRLRRRRRERGARMTPRIATFGVFFVNGAVIGTWVGHIPWVQERFDFSKSTLGLVILAMAIGVIVALPIMGQAIVRLGSVRATRHRRHHLRARAAAPAAGPRAVAAAARPHRPRRVERRDGRLDERPRRRGRAHPAPADHVLAARRLELRRARRRRAGGRRRRRSGSTRAWRR